MNEQATVRILDTETTGVDPSEAGVVELACVDLDTAEHWHSMVDPERPISFGAMATHLIMPGDVKGAPTLVETLMDFPIKDSDFLVAHNAPYDREVLGDLVNPSVPWICTYRCALHLMPNAESHRNLSLCMEAGLNIFDAPEVADNPKASMPHRALFDTWATRKLLIHLFGLAQIRLGMERGWAGSSGQDRLSVLEEMHRLSTAPVRLKKIGFGKHFGTLWDDVDTGYLQWVLRQDFDQDVRYTAETILSERQNPSQGGLF